MEVHHFGHILKDVVGAITVMEVHIQYQGSFDFALVPQFCQGYSDVVKETETPAMARAGMMPGGLIRPKLGSTCSASAAALIAPPVASNAISQIRLLF